SIRSTKLPGSGPSSRNGMGRSDMTKSPLVRQKRKQRPGSRPRALRFQTPSLFSSWSAASAALLRAVGDWIGPVGPGSAGGAGGGGGGGGEGGMEVGWGGQRAGAGPRGGEPHAGAVPGRTPNQDPAGDSARGNVACPASAGQAAAHLRYGQEIGISRHEIP